MKTVITYGTYDLLHRGHIRLLERARALGDRLIVGVTAEDFDKVRGKINVQQSLMERIEAVKATGLADEVIVEEYEGQKIDDIRRYNVDVFTVGSDWVGFFDYLKEYCEVVYLDRTQGVSSTDLREETGAQSVGFVGDAPFVIKHIDELRYVNGMEGTCIFSGDEGILHQAQDRGLAVCGSMGELLERVDSVYIASHPTLHAKQAEQALRSGRHVLCEAPMALRVEDLDRLFAVADEEGVVLMDGLKTAYATAYHRLKLLVKSGRIGTPIGVDATCTSLMNLESVDEERDWSSFCNWGPTALLPVFQLLGADAGDVRIVSKMLGKSQSFDVFSSVSLAYDDAIGTIKIGNGVKSEGELVVSGTRGYIHVPAPWWKTDYFEVRYEDPTANKRYFYNLDGEGIRYEFVCFHKAVTQGAQYLYVERETSRAIVSTLEKFLRGERRELKPCFISPGNGTSSSPVGSDGISTVLA